MFGLPGGIEMLILVGLLVLLFGSSQIPKLAHALGKSKTELQRGLKEGMQAADAESDS